MGQRQVRVPNGGVGHRYGWISCWAKCGVGAWKRTEKAHRRASLNLLTPRGDACASFSVGFTELAYAMWRCMCKLQRPERVHFLCAEEVSFNDDGRLKCELLHEFGLHVVQQLRVDWSFSRDSFTVGLQRGTSRGLRHRLIRRGPSRGSFKGVLGGGGFVGVLYRGPGGITQGSFTVDLRGDPVEGPSAGFFGRSLRGVPHQTCQTGVHVRYPLPHYRVSTGASSAKKLLPRGLRVLLVALLALLNQHQMVTPPNPERPDIRAFC